MDEKFYNWLTKELNKRAWSNSELGRRAQVSGSLVSMVFNRQRTPTADFCIAIAQALDISPENVLRIAGYLPPLTADLCANNPLLDEAVQIFIRLPPGVQQAALLMLRGLDTGTQERDTSEAIQDDMIDYQT